MGEALSAAHNTRLLHVPIIVRLCGDSFFMYERRNEDFIFHENICKRHRIVP